MNAIQKTSTAGTCQASIPRLDLDEARRFLNMLDPKGTFTFQTFADNKDSPSKVQRNTVLHGSFDEHSQRLADLNAQGAGIFVMVNEGNGVVLPGNKTCRTAKNVVRVRCAFVDLDGSPLEPVLKAPVLPSIVVESSPNRWHAYWGLEDCPLERFKPLQMALAEKYAGDLSVTDLCRVMRLPGFIHQKHEPFITRIVDINKTEENNNGSN